MVILVTSAAGGNGDGYGALLGFALDGKALGAFSNDSRIADPRGLVIGCGEDVLFLNSGADRVVAIDATGQVIRDSGVIEGLNPGGGNFGPDGRYFVGSRSARTIVGFPSTLRATCEPLLPRDVVPFPRGFAFCRDGRLFLASGIGPDGAGENCIVVFNPGEFTKPRKLVSDPQLSPLDLAIAPNGNVLVSSEYPFGAPDAVTGIKEYDAADGRLVRVFSPSGAAELRRPRGLRFHPAGHLYCAAQDEVVAFDFASGRCLGMPVRFHRLHGQALAFFHSEPR